MSEKRCLLALSLYSFLFTYGIIRVNCLSIQAMINLDNDSEDLIGLLIDKVDSIIDPQISDSENATHELANALLRIGPLISINGTISDAAKKFRMKFSCDIKAMSSAAAVFDKESLNIQSLIGEQNTNRKELRIGGVLEQAKETMDLILQYMAMLVFNGLLTNIVTNIMTEAAIHSNVNFM